MDSISNNSKRKKQFSVKIRETIQSLIKQATGERNTVLTPRLFIDLLDGDCNAALVLNQVLYWCERSTHPEGWFYKTYDQWHEELHLTKYQIKRVFDGDPRVAKPKKTLRDIGVETQVRRAPSGSPTVHYRIDLPRFMMVLRTFLAERFGLTASVEDAAEMPVNGHNVDSGKSTSLTIESQQCALSSDPENTTKNSTEIESGSSTNTAQNDDDDLKEILHHQKKFGKLKARTREVLKPLIAAVGWATTHEVLNRCAKRGRSWQYVIKALANEARDHHKVTSENSVGSTRFAGQTATQSPAHPLVPTSIEELQARSAWIEALRAEEEAKKAARMPHISKTVNTFWRENPLFGRQTVNDAWEMVRSQLEAQLDRGTYSTYIRDMVLTDFDLEAQQFTFVLEDEYRRCIVAERMNVQIYNLLSVIYGSSAITLRYCTRAEWHNPSRMETETAGAGA